MIYTHVLNKLSADRYRRSIDQVRDGESAIASTRGTCAPQNVKCWLDFAGDKSTLGP
jgi:hypothetical protein